ncbi:response regulator [Aquimarina sp. ERC-38]|uniref:response regulator n=1 Tax=Aquimarina sp. ERC-38 TaxID=2949996 RepID=UPI0022487235|nr:response regulator [Aquimarina sp. ERC-38]UZO82249.1 response regulator [Aquimarina sp. ERC-38]
MKTLKILLIEDDEIERLKFGRVLSKNGYPHQLQEAINGEEAIQILETPSQLPDLILLDLNMPKMNGLEFLTMLKKDERLKYIPVIILSTSNNHKDVKQCYEAGIAGYMIKPLKYEAYVDKMKALLNYWSLNELFTS